MLRDIEKFIIDKKLINKGEKILVALSGGPDSVALLHILHSLKERFDMELGAAHINHLLRGEAADADQEFARRVCNELGVEFYLKREDISAYSKRYGIGEEEAGRRVRYGFFDKICKEKGYDKIAVAHNLDDNIETFLFRLMRGTGLEGLSSIPLRRDNIIRPLMEKKKKEILEYLEEQNYEYCIDETNNKNIYTRNKIRLDLIPYMEKEFNSNLVEAISNLIEEIDETNRYLQGNIKGTIKGNSVKIETLLKYDKIFRKRIYNNLLKNYPVEVSRRKLDSIDELIFSQGNKELNLGEGYFIKKGYKDIKVMEKREKKKEKGKIPLEINQKIMYNGYRIESKLVEKLPRQREGFYFDYEKLNGELIIRTRENGDKFVPFGMKSRKKLKNFFIDSKVDKDVRDRLPIITTGDEILLVGNLRASNLFKVDKDTKKILLLKVKEGESNEGQ